MPPKASRTAAPPDSEPVQRSSRLLGFLHHRSALAAAAFTLLATLRIVSTYGVFNHTSDEPAHIACGMEWLANGTYQIEAQHPPLARVAAALGPWLAGVPFPSRISKDELDMYFRGQAIFGYGGHYTRNLALARAGILPFFWLGCLVCYSWGKRISPEAGALATLSFSMVPTVLAHAGLATTDVALTACLGAAFLAGVRWVERPSLGRAAVFGVAAGFALLAKHSTLVFFPAAVVAALAWYWVAERPKLRDAARRAWQMLPGLALASGIVFFLIWAGFRFSFGHTALLPFRVPFPEYFEGLRQVSEHNKMGHVSYLLGSVNMSGYLMFYPVALAVKTPIGMLALLAAATVMAWRKRAVMKGAGLPAAFAAGILAVGLTSRINIGVRHVLPMYMGFSVIVAVVCAEMLRRTSAVWLRRGALAAMLWFCGSSLLSHPDYIPYFNAFAGNQPENILADSDLDWGQDGLRLSKRLRELQAPELFFAQFVNADYEGALGFPPTYNAMPLQPGPGWNAISISALKIYRLGLHMTQPNAILWPYRFPPTERVGKTILLYYFPPEQFRK